VGDDATSAADADADAVAAAAEAAAAAAAVAATAVAAAVVIALAAQATNDASPGALRRPPTAEEQAVVTSAWAHGDGDNNVVCSLAVGAGGSSVDILGKHFGRMRKYWLFDESVNAYMFLLQKRDKLHVTATGCKPSHFMSSFFFEKV
jgi:hypothetical protein